MTSPRLAAASVLCALALSGGGQVTPTSPDRLALAAAGDPTPSAPASVAPRPVLRPKVPAKAPSRAGAEESGRLPSAAEWRRAAARVDAMSLPELAGQVIVAKYSGTTAPVRLVRRLHLGGVIVFTENVTSTDQIRRSNTGLTDRVHRPLLVGVDQEGGAVARVTGAATRFRPSCPPAPPTTPR